MRSLCLSADAVTVKEGMNSFNFNFAANTGRSSSQPLQPAKANHVSGATDGVINTGQPYTLTGLAPPPHSTPPFFVPNSAIALTAPHSVSSGGRSAQLRRTFISGR